MVADSPGSQSETGFVCGESSRRSLKKVEHAQSRRLLTLKRFCLGPMSIVVVGSLAGVVGVRGVPGLSILELDE